jgi:hypothetical protein
MAAMRNPYGLKNGEIVTIDSVERGLACGCVCPKCGWKLEARKGDKKEHHFAHDDGPDCGAAYQTALHILAKEVIEEGGLLLPPLAIYPSQRLAHPLGNKVYREVVGEEVLIRPDAVSLEHKIGRFIPDVVVQFKQRMLLVEIWVTHRADAANVAKIEELDIGAIQFNFSKMDRMVTKDDLHQVLTIGKECAPAEGQSLWLFHPHQHRSQQKFDRDFSADPSALVQETQELNRRKRIRQDEREFAEARRLEEEQRKKRFLF